MPEQQKVDESIESLIKDNKKLKKAEDSSTSLEDKQSNTLETDTIDDNDVEENIDTDDEFNN